MKSWLEKFERDEKKSVINLIFAYIMFTLSGILLKNALFGALYAVLFWIVVSYKITPKNNTKHVYIMNFAGAIFLMIVTYVSSYFMVDTFPGVKNSLI